MSRWKCPQCEREFAVVHQAHVCVPGGTVEQTFAGKPAWQLAICQAIVAHLRDLGPLHIDAVTVGVFLKHEHKLAELRPHARSLQMWLILPRPLNNDRIAKALRISEGRFAHLLKFTSVDEVDAELTGWLSEAYFAAS